jgi:hypothetical protein
MISVTDLSTFLSEGPAQGDKQFTVVIYNRNAVCKLHCWLTLLQLKVTAVIFVIVAFELVLVMLRLGLRLQHNYCTSFTHVDCHMAIEQHTLDTNAGI